MKAETKVTTQQLDLQRQLGGTAFLSLEHWSYMILVVLLPLLLLCGFHAALVIWASPGTNLSMMTPMLKQALGVPIAVGIAAALLVLAPLLFVLRRRTQAEMLKRPGYEMRLAYKLPIYGALGVLLIMKLIAGITLVAAFLYSLTLIGVKGADIGEIYLGQFLPALLAGAVFGLTSWYVVKLAKGKNLSSQFVLSIAGLSTLMIVTLFTTVIMTTHNQKNDAIDRKPYPLHMQRDYNYWLE